MHPELRIGNFVFGGYSEQHPCTLDTYGLPITAFLRRSVLYYSTTLSSTASNHTSYNVKLRIIFLSHILAFAAIKQVWLANYSSNGKMT